MLQVSNEAKMIAQAIFEKKAEQILVINVGKILGITDYFIIATVLNPVQAEAVIDAVEETAENLGLEVIGTSGSKESSWILIDCGDVVVHLFSEEGRNYYRLESLWKDCPTFEINEETGELKPVSEVEEKI